MFEPGLVPAWVEPAHKDAQVMTGHPGIEVLLLGNIADLPLLVNGRAADPFSKKLDQAGIGLLDAHQHLDRRRFAGAVPAQEPIDIAAANSQVQPFENGVITVTFTQVPGA